MLKNFGPRTEQLVNFSMFSPKVESDQLYNFSNVSRRIRKNLHREKMNTPQGNKKEELTTG